MEARIRQDVLLSALSRAQSVLERKTSRPILEMVLLEEMEMQSWFAVTYSRAFGGELFLMLQ